MTEKMRAYLMGFKTDYDKLDWNDHMVMTGAPGHTLEVADLPAVHAGRESANQYVLGKLINALGEKEGTAILEELAKLQVRRKGDPMDGAFRWYREETRPRDTNAAFFTLAPLATVRLMEPDCLSEGEKALIDDILGHSYPWFSGECSEPILWYTNKIVSDGALLSAIGSLTGKADYKKEARVFLNRWLEYTETRGYGWGENMSVGYNGVTLQAFALIRAALDDTVEDRLINNRFDTLEETILETFRFHKGHDFVPVIRTYNVEGFEEQESLLFNMAGVKNQGLDKINVPYPAVPALLYGSRLYFDEADYQGRSFEADLPAPRKRITPIMDDVEAYSWLGENGGLGSLNRFPVIDGSYQHKTWGLGWQCMPVNLIVYGGQVSFLRFNVDDGERMRHHPHRDKHRDYLDPALFGESFYPDVKTRCFQRDNTLVAFRSMEKLRNRARLITDSLDVQRFTGTAHELAVKGRRWTVLEFPKAALFISTLEGIPSRANGPVPPGDNVNNRKALAPNGPRPASSLAVEQDGNDLSLVQTLYRGDLRQLFDDRIAAGWLIHFVDNHLTREEAAAYLQDFTLFEKRGMDNRIPRTPEWFVHEFRLSRKGKEVLAGVFDPYE